MTQAVYFEDDHDGEDFVSSQTQSSGPGVKGMWSSGLG